MKMTIGEFKKVIDNFNDSIVIEIYDHVDRDEFNNLNATIKIKIYELVKQVKRLVSYGKNNEILAGNENKISELEHVVEYINIVKNQYNESLRIISEENLDKENLNSLIFAIDNNICVIVDILKTCELYIADRKFACKVNDIKNRNRLISNRILEFRGL